ncbi:hypothetical protein C8F04DRAFT_1193561 [Mycena alexandri]|uniref:Uncharacterized protein n=1 Tax=Mycena alexandri TaxID=1745969 RepID=A0AAD6S9D2_9AGAR|nr:hypothetical protein C8F04DRAFT_1193561 [Mycena alexandri]
MAEASKRGGSVWKGRRRRELVYVNDFGVGRDALRAGVQGSRYKEKGVEVPQDEAESCACWRRRVGGTRLAEGAPGVETATTGAFGCLILLVEACAVQTLGRSAKGAVPPGTITETSGLGFGRRRRDEGRGEETLRLRLAKNEKSANALRRYCRGPQRRLGAVATGAAAFGCPKDEEEDCMGTDVDSACEAEGEVGRLWGQVREITSFRGVALPHCTDQAAPIELHESANGHTRTSLRVRYFLVGFLFRARADRSLRALDALDILRTSIVNTLPFSARSSHSRVRMTRIAARHSPLVVLERLHALRCTAIANSTDIPDPFYRVFAALARRRYKHEGRSGLYIKTRVPKAVQEDYNTGKILLNTFLDHLEVKLGHSNDVERRHREYNKCAVRQVLHWQYYYPVEDHMLAEYYKFHSIGSFERLDGIIEFWIENLGQTVVKPRTDRGGGTK